MTVAAILSSRTRLGRFMVTVDSFSIPQLLKGGQRCPRSTVAR